MLRHVFDPDRLIPKGTLTERLAAFLDEARAAMGLVSLAVVELGAPDGRMAPRWCGSSPAIAVDPPTLAQFEAWVGAPPTRPDAAALGLDPATTVVVLVPLSVTPALARRVDAIALVASPADRPRPDPGALGALQQVLERGLSADRAERLARTVYAAATQAADPMEITDRTGRLLWVNPAWERFFRYSRAEAVGQTVGALFRDPVRPVHDEAFYQFTMSRLVAGAPWLGTLACRTGDRDRVFIEVHVGPFEADGFHGNVAVRRDIAHRVERDAALIIAHSEFRSVLAAIPDGVAVLRGGRIYFANAAFLDMVERTEAAVIGQPYVSFVHPDDELALEAIPTGLSRVRMVTPRGSNRIAEISVAGSVSFEGQPSMIVLSRDTTDDQLAQEQLAQTERMSALGALAAGIAHEINNPLAYVLLNLELLRQRAALEPAAADALAEAMDGAARIHRIVSELRGFSGSDRDRVAEPVAVAKAVTSAVNIAQNEIRHRARLEREHEAGLHVWAREGELVQVLVNLLVNAAQAIPEDHPGDHVIGVDTRRWPDGRVAIAVSDTGAGIPSDILPRLFDPFVSTKRRGEGSGLGLTITKRIVDQAGGEVLVDTSQDGTVVTVVLPSAPAPDTPPLPEPRPDRPAEPARRVPRVLVVDDEPAILRALGRVLSGYDVVTAHDGRTALERIEAAEGAFDVVLCDVMMPGMAGSELYRRARAARPELAGRFVFMTGGAFTPRGHEFLDSVAERVLEKPFDPRAVVAMIAEVAAAVEAVAGRLPEASPAGRPG